MRNVASRAILTTGQSDECPRLNDAVIRPLARLDLATIAVLPFSSLQYGITRIKCDKWGASTMLGRYRRPRRHQRVQAVERMHRGWEAEREALSTVRHYNETSFGQKFHMVPAEDCGRVAAKHPRLVAVCDA
jgi:hypothetical protein